MDGKEGKRMNKKKQAGQALLLAAALVLAGCPGSPFQRTYAEAEPSARKTGAWKNPSPENRPWRSIGRRPVHGMGCTGAFSLRRILISGTAP